MYGCLANQFGRLSMSREVVAVVPALQETPEVLTAAFLAVAFAERLPERMPMADQRQSVQAQQATHAGADCVAEVQVEDAVEAIVLVEWTNATQVGTPQYQ